MTRRSGAVVGGVIAILLLALWWFVRDVAPESRAPDKSTVAERGTAGSIASSAPWSDPRTQPRASISGRITDDAKAPIARAQVCTSPVGSALPSALTRVLTCVLTDEQGRYRIGELIAASYVVHASARGFRPGAFYPTPGAANHEMALAAGEARTGADVELKRGGAEITGVVLDASGGPVARAEVREATRGSAHAGAAAETDEQGRFSLWTERGHVTLEASADGYVRARGTGRSPGALEIFLMPASSLAGTVVDAATGQPIAGAQIELDLEYARDSEVRDVTGANGTFRLEPLEPGRYTVAARAEHGYGRTAGSVLVGLGQHVEGAVVKLFPAHRVAGKVVIAGSGKDCADARVRLLDRTSDRTIELRAQPGGLRVADGLLPGTYNVSVRCAGYVVRDSYEPIVVGDRDVSGVTWEVEEGARIRGKIRTPAGTAVDGASVRAQSFSGRGQTAWIQARSKADGSFELRDLGAGTHKIAVGREGVRLPSGVGVEVTVAALATLERDFVLEDTGTLTGSVVDDTGAAVPGVGVAIIGAEGRSYLDRVTSDATGAFVVEGLPAGNYRVRTHSVASDSLDDQQPVQLAVRAGETATVKLTVASQRGTITGTVVDAANQPVPDAFLSWALESGGPQAAANVARTREEWRSEARPVLTAPDGSFQLTGLMQGTYTVRAYRKGGGEAIAEHVAIGATAKLQLKATGSLAGTARTAGAPPRDMEVVVRNTATGLRRSESFYMTGGQFTVTDLPAGRFDILVAAEGSQATTAVDLRDGEARTGVDVELIPLVTVTGRLVEHGTQKPVAGYAIHARPGHGAGGDMLRRVDDTENVSDEAGRFTLRRMPAGDVFLLGFPRTTDAGAETFEAYRTIRGTGTVDIGDVGVIMPRSKPGDAGAIGIRFESPSPDQVRGPPELKIAGIDPAGPAASTGLQVGDVITTCDGVDVTGSAVINFWKLVRAPPGTKLTLGTRRGVTVALVLGRRPVP